MRVDLERYDLLPLAFSIVFLARKRINDSPEQSLRLDVPTAPRCEHVKEGRLQTTLTNI
jgi:hypothetical protein